MTDKIYYAQDSGTLLDKIEQPESSRIIGYRFKSFDAEARTIETTFDVSDKLLNAGGTVQGGFLAAMLDETMGGLVVLLTEGRRRAVSLSLNISYLSAARSGVLLGRGVVTKLGRTTLFSSAELIRDDGAVVARAEQVGAFADIS